MPHQPRSHPDPGPVPARTSGSWKPTLTGLAPGGHRDGPQPKSVPAGCAPARFGLVACAPDLTVSVNLASQLPLPLAKLLGRRFSEGQLERLGALVVEAHFTALARVPGRVCVACDVAWERIEEGKVVNSRDALSGARRPRPERIWTWDIAPRPEESFSHDRRNLVHGWLDFARCLGGPGPGAVAAGAA